MHLTANYLVPGLGYSFTVEQVANAVVSDSNMSSLGRHSRRLESGPDYVSYVKTTEYRIAVRVGHHNTYGYDYHFMEQLSDGSWAHKPGILYSRNDINDPETDLWNLYNVDNVLLYSGFYDSDIIYLAVSIS